jgi:membrane protease YdiL (CAAX protease family)
MNAVLTNQAWIKPWFAPLRTYAVLIGLALVGMAVASVGTGWQRIWLLLVLAPLVEECVFRAGLQEYLLARFDSAIWATALTALVFGLVHAAARADAAALVVAAPALLVGAVYWRWRKLRWCVGLHSVMNAIWLGWSHVVG